MRHVLTTAAPAPALAQAIDWSIQREGSSADGGKVQLTIENRWDSRSRSMWSNDYAIRGLHGLPAAQVVGPTRPVTRR